MAKQQKSFIKGRMNKDVDERLLPDGEYIDAQNVRLGSTELSEVGAVENSKGNTKLTTLQYDGVALSDQAECIGAYADDARETIYWFVHDPNNPQATGGVVDMIVSFNTNSQQLTYHVVSATAVIGEPTTLNFNPTYRLGEWNVDIIDDLLFWTDNYNQPRKININRAYPQPIAHVDQFTELDISVIKPQPLEAPTIELQNNLEDSNYIEDIFISFSYRYRYKDGEYSATSQFSDIAFDPSIFYIKESTILNEGMVNEFNSVSITFNTGSENVRGIDILYKKSDSNTIYLAKKIDKDNPLLPDNIDQTIVFDNSDIYSILNEGEILRMYDNVPRLAGAQTIMGRRLMYGDYLEGRDLVDENGNDVFIDYTVDLVSTNGNLDSEEYTVSDTTPYDYDFTGNTITRSNASLLIDVTGKPTLYYSSDVELRITVTFKSEGIYRSDGTKYTSAQLFGFVDPDGTEFTTRFTYTTDGNYPTAYQAYNTNEFKDKTGENGFEGDPSLWGQDGTLTGQFNYISPAITSTAFPDFIPLRSGQDSASPSSDPIKFEVQSDGRILVVPNAIQYDNGVDTNSYQFFSIVTATASWIRKAGKKSLHSNRDYQVGIVYQDAEGRQTTVFESENNTVHVDDSKSASVNSLKVTIPVSMKPPSWADRYKFVAKQSKTDYETIYSTRAYVDPDTGRHWIFLDGEQGNKVSTGQELIVKKDATGPVTTEVRTTVLDVASQPSNFLPTNTITEIAGLYASVDPDGWDIDDAQFSTLTNNQISVGQNTTGLFSGYVDYPPDLYYPVHNTSNGENWQIPEGSVVSIDVLFSRRGNGSSCGDEICRYNKQFIASQDYADFRQFWIVEGVDLSESDCSETNDPSGVNSFSFDQNEGIYTGITQSNIEGENQAQFFRDAVNNRLYLRLVTGSPRCGSRRSIVSCRLEVVTQEGLLVFETVPSETANNIYYENEQSFPITNGFHISGSVLDDQNQTAVQPAIVNLTFFNCFTFLNGVESYKSRDSITGSKFYLGQRVTAVSEQDYKEIRRNSSITYSGIYNEQTNLNKLNEFNLGLSNYKDLEISYGDIGVIHGRRTDLLVLQEDRVSYVGVGKNLLTDAVGGGIITSVPEVLGTQVARVEEYGISHNPESFVSDGADIYFTDAKRSAVIQLKGGSSAESLNVISDMGMRTWFRDMFQTSFSYQKLGGYDPYMDEYVLSPTTTLIPSDPVVYKCGGGSRVFTGLLSAQQFTIDAGSLYGEMTITVNATNAVQVTATYNGTDYSQTGTSFSFNFDKDIPSVNEVLITITPTDPDGSSSTEISVSCPVADTITIVPIMITSAVDAGDLIHNSYNYTDTSVSPNYQSPFQGGQYQFINQSQQQYVSANLVSQYGPLYTGQQGSGSIPIDGATVTMYSTKLFGDTFDFDTTKHRFRYLRTATGYGNNATDIANLLAASLSNANGGTSPAFFSNFTMPAGADGDYLYLIWDYRENAELKLCYSSTSDVSEACCECFSSPSCVPFLGTTIEGTDAAACALSPTTTYYTSVIVSGGVANTQPVSGTTVYTSLGCSSGNTVTAGFIKLTDNTWVEVDSDGIVINTGSC